MLKWIRIINIEKDADIVLNTNHICGFGKVIKTPEQTDFAIFFSRTEKDCTIIGFSSQDLRDDVYEKIIQFITIQDQQPIFVITNKS